MDEVEVYTITVYVKNEGKGQGHDDEEVYTSRQPPEESLTTLTIVDQSGHGIKYPWHAVRKVTYYTGGE